MSLVKAVALALALTGIWLVIGPQIGIPPGSTPSIVVSFCIGVVSVVLVGVES